ncbi:hypothetical protein K7X08_004296 [Anisodus acutangulus]|uniref:Lactation elevated protein 1 n=1 Tax=Anisodus acutangulus TaxID=402998 RepID=A0A9Q1MKF4_9SOLA|nr:hypothetical protein K7X08_004296 [Anisodus acutangulus]
MLKALMPVAVYTIGILLKKDKFKNSTMCNMVAISVGVCIAAYGEAKFDCFGVLLQLFAVLVEATRLVLIQILLNLRGISLNPISTLYYVAPSCFVFLFIPWDTVTTVNLIGYGLAFLGVAYYNHQKLQILKVKEAEKKAQQDDEEVGRLLNEREHNGIGKKGLLARYRSLVEQGKLQHDPYQEKVASELQSLLGRLEHYEKDMEEYHATLAQWEDNRESRRRKLLMDEAEAKQQGAFIPINKSRNIFQRWMSRKPEDVEEGVGKWVSYLNREKKLDSQAMLEINEHMHKIWKSQMEQKSLQSSLSGWVMNLPFDSKVKEWIEAEERYKQEVQMKNVLLDVADKFLVNQADRRSGASILCFDEIQTVDVFAIVALSGILSRLLSTGTVLVATSNRAPADLNQKEPLDLSYDSPLLSIRTLEVPESCNGVARFNFEYLCGRLLGAADYIAVAKRYHTVFVSDIPIMSMGIRDKARRFITLIDELYNHHCCLNCSAVTSVEDLFQGTAEGTLFDLESFQFETEIEGTKLRRDVLAEGNVNSGGAPSGIISMLSGQEEMFSFRRAYVC